MMMDTATKSPYSSEQIAAWLRGLLTIALVNGKFDDHEKQLISEITKNELAPGLNLEGLEVITPEELAVVLGKNTKAAENFLRTAVMVAIADGTYSPSEDEILHQLCQALELKIDALEALRHTLEDQEKLKHTLKSITPQTPPADILHPHT